MENQFDLNNNKKSSAKQIVLAILLLLVVVGGVVGIGSWLIQYQKGLKNPPESALLKTEPTFAPEKNISPTVASLSKKEMKIRVLNGSDTVGEAGEVKIILEDDGFETIEIDNADETIDDTTISHTASVSSQMVVDIKKLLEKTFSPVKISTDSQPTSFDLEIITGKNRL